MKILWGFLLLVLSVSACTTIAAGPRTTADGSVMVTHSNDGAGDAVGNLKHFPRTSWPAGSTRKVHSGFIPQVPVTFSYYSGGYPSINEYQVGLAESTCNAVLPGNAALGSLDIVDLSGIALERSKTAREAITIMGEMVEAHGYMDNGESLFVMDPTEVYAFHVLPDSTQKKGIWVAQRVPDDHVAVIANAFNIRKIDTTDSKNFLFSKNLISEAIALGWNASMPLDFTRIFSGKELGHKYASGRRMWMIYSLLTDAKLSPTYDEFVSSAPYPTTLPAKTLKGITLSDLMAVMRNQYEGTPFDMTSGAMQMSGGPFSTPTRWADPTPKIVTGNWERTISTWRSILSYVLVARNWLPDAVGGQLWIAFHAAKTSLYTPFPVGLTQGSLPVSFTNSSWDKLDRGISAWHASRFLFNIAQLRFSSMVKDIASAQDQLETQSQQNSAQYDKLYLQTKNIETVSEKYAQNAAKGIQAWWDLSDHLMLKYADGFCNGCPVRNEGYPDWWLKEVGYQDGPPDSPPVN